MKIMQTLWWEYVGIVIALIVFPFSITAVIELGLSLYQTPCQGQDWSKDEANKVCPFREDRGICGLMATIGVGKRSLFYVISNGLACNSVIVLQAASVAIFIFLSIFWIRAIFQRKEIAHNNYILFQMLLPFCFIVAVAQLVNVSILTAGYGYLCKALDTSKCRNVYEYRRTRYACHMSHYELPSCRSFGEDGFAGKLRVALGVSWISFLAVLIHLLATLMKLYHTPHQKIVNENKAGEFPVAGPNPFYVSQPTALPLQSSQSHFTDLGERYHYEQGGNPSYKFGEFEDDYNPTTGTGMEEIYDGYQTPVKYCPVNKGVTNYPSSLHHAGQYHHSGGGHHKVHYQDQDPEEEYTKQQRRHLPQPPLQQTNMGLRQPSLGESTF